MGAHNPERTMSLLGHLVELRRRFLASLAAFVVCFAAAFAGYHKIIGLFTGLFRDIENGLGARLFANTLPEGFLVQLRIAAAVALIASMPVHLVNIARFVFPALGRKTRRVFAAGMLASFLLALVGVLICYFHILPWSIRFLAGSGFIPRDVGLLLNLDRSVSYVLSFALWAIVTFQSPLALLVLLALNILKREAVFRASRFVIVAIFVVSAVVTPSVDPVSQCAIALPLVALHFLALLVAKLFRVGEGRLPGAEDSGGDRCSASA